MHSSILAFALALRESAGLKDSTVAHLRSLLLAVLLWPWSVFGQDTNSEQALVMTGKLPCLEFKWQGGLLTRPSACAFIDGRLRVFERGGTNELKMDVHTLTNALESISRAGFFEIHESELDEKRYSNSNGVFSVSFTMTTHAPIAALTLRWNGMQRTLRRVGAMRPTSGGRALPGTNRFDTCLRIAESNLFHTYREILR
jgi:hypothetical protein